MIGQMKIFLWFVVICGLGELENVQAINILGIVSSLSKSHSVFANAIFNEYANSGHSVTVLSPYEVSLKITHYKLDGLEKLKRNFRSHQNLQVDEYTALLQLYEEGLATTKAVINHDSFKKLISAPLHIDVIILDYDYNDALLAIAHRFKCPIFILAIDTPSLTLKRIINPGYPVTNLIFQQPIADIGVSNALWDVMANMYEKFIVNFYYANHQETLYQKIISGLATPSKEEPSNRIAKMFTSTLSPPFLTTNKLVNLISLHIPEKRISEYFVADPLDRFIHSTDEGCIYVSLGADTDPATLPKNRIYTMFQVFHSRPEKIIWAWNGNTTNFAGSNKFFVSSWMPQDDIFGHRNIRAFVTNGGSLSMQEAIYHGIPTIGIPLTYQQRDNVDLMVAKGLGVKVEMSNLTIESFMWALNEVIDNNSFKYKERLAFEADLMENQLKSPMETVKYWIKYFHQYRYEDVISNTRLSVIDYYLSDIYLLVFLLIFLFLVIAVISYIKLYRIASRYFVQRKYKYY
ncbi:UDP-glycosyltransferase UGT5-like [Hermetia illucens]|uniref:UDP-glycosyltransferase UGT5-like n=1 Tax=Hermetia illucens TaxID=343691 RepID=UPI0018CC3423|nr:UDP-glycosyltransferase UGT5-like [Hermetia illucens]